MEMVNYGTHPSKWEDVKICTYACCGNDKKFLRHWIANLWFNGKGSDYICVLDTGSTDGSYEELLALRDEYNIPKERLIIEREEIKPWRFDAGRNASMKLIPSEDKIDVCFCIDPDELVIDDFWEDLRKLVFEHPDFLRIYYQYGWSHDSVSGDPKWVFWYDKIMPTFGHYWRGAVHEACVCQEEMLDNFHHAYYMSSEKIYLHHYPDSEKPRSYYLGLLETRVDEDAEDCLGKFYLAREYMLTGAWEKLLAVGYKLFVQMNKAEPTKRELAERADSFIIPSICILMGEACTNLNMLDEAQDWFEKCIKASDQYIEGYIRLMELCIRIGNTELGLQTLYKMKCVCKVHEDWRIRPFMWRVWKQKHIEAVLLDLAGKAMDAKAAFETALADLKTAVDEAEATEQGLFRDIEVFNERHKEGQG